MFIFISLKIGKKIYIIQVKIFFKKLGNIHKKILLKFRKLKFKLIKNSLSPAGNKDKLINSSLNTYTTNITF